MRQHIPGETSGLATGRQRQNDQVTRRDLFRRVPAVLAPAVVASAVSAPACIRAAEQFAENSSGPVLGIPPADDDWSATALKNYQLGMIQHFGGLVRNIPLETKAQHLEWVLARYLLAPYNQLHHSVSLPELPGQPPAFLFGDDVATWQGACVAAMSYRLAVTRDPGTRELLCRLLDGLHLMIEATGSRGLIARCLLERDAPEGKCTVRYQADDGRVFYLRSEAAKGTFNQVAGGLAICLLVAGDQLPEPVRNQARDDLSQMAHHLVYHDYRLTEADGKHTEYGNMIPRIGPQSVPFNAQVAYTVVAAGHTFPSDDPVVAKRVRRGFEELREKHHVYYEAPVATLIRPQEIGGSPLLKGMNDRNHVLNAAYVSLMLELVASRQAGREPDRRFLYEMGQTMVHTINRIQYERNALCNLMWAAMISDPDAGPALLPRPGVQTQQQLRFLVETAIEQLRRCPVDRFNRPGDKIETRTPQWVDAQRPFEVYYWKAGAFNRFEETGPSTNVLNIATDFLHAYWLMRYFRIEERITA
ncbi:MAG: hypothetical protein KDA79_20825 [Planctomycetaceae bacterium]|nr:hypothetical protein [Planctomycetaceae bacterium]